MRPELETAFWAQVEANAMVREVHGASDPRDLADAICEDDAALGIGFIGPSVAPAVAKAAYEWRCPDRVPEAVRGLEAEANEVARRAEEERQRAEEDRRRQAEEAARAEIGISLEEFHEIRAGMSYGEVEAIVGSPGELTVETVFEGYEGQIYSWSEEDRPGEYLGGNASMQFENGRLISKSQFGLR